MKAPRILGRCGRAALLAAAITLAAAPVFALRYCVEESVDGCVQKVTCDYYNDGQWAGSVVIRYDCRPSV